MITLELGQLYGMDSEKELMQTIKELKNTGICSMGMLLLIPAVIFAIMLLGILLYLMF